MNDRNRRRLGTETLENRKLMAVSVFSQSGDLFINGDGASDMISVYSLGGNSVRVEGISGSGTTVNGQTRASFTFTDDLYIDLGNGNNWLDIKSLNGGIEADDVRIRSGNGNDKLWVSGMETRSDLRFESGAGSDDIQVVNSDVGNGSGDDLRIYSGAGADYITINNTDVVQDAVLKTYGSASESSRDEIRADGLRVGDDIWVDFAEGDDYLNMKRTETGDKFDIDARGGRDYLFINSNSKAGGDLDIQAGDGNDTVGVYQTWVGNDLIVDGGDGNNDSLYTWNNTVNDDERFSDIESFRIF